MWNMLLPTILRMSFTGSIVILTVLLARLLLRRTPKIFSYLLWSVVLLRLLCPVSFSAQLSLFQFVDISEKPDKQVEYRLQNFTHHQNTGLPVLADKASREAKLLPAGEPYSSYSFTETLLLWGTVVWFIGMACMLTYSVISLIRFRRQLIGAVNLRDNIYLTDYISSAFVFGLLKPKIYLPAMLSNAEQEYIIMHEQVHIRRKDYLTKILAFMALAIHWFNPLVWLALRLSDKDMEMSCDEAVMKKMDRDIRAEYSASLLKLATGKRSLSGTLPAFGESDTKHRITHVLHYKKPTAAVVLAATIIMTATVVFAGSDPKKLDTESKKTNSASLSASASPSANASTNNTSTKDSSTGKTSAKDKNAEHFSAQSTSSGKTSAKDKNAEHFSAQSTPSGKTSAKDKNAEHFSAQSTSDLDKTKGNKYAHSVTPLEFPEGKTDTESMGINEDYVHTMECAFLRSMSEDTIEVDPVEYIDRDTDPKRLKELGITLQYLNEMDGYELNNPDTNTLTWKIDENTEFIFLDWGQDFIVEQTPVKSITIKTKDKELFRCYLATYKNSKPGMPFFFEVENGVVKRIVEKFFA